MPIPDFVVAIAGGGVVARRAACRSPVVRSRCARMGHVRGHHRRRRRNADRPPVRGGSRSGSTSSRRRRTSAAALVRRSACSCQCCWWRFCSLPDQRSGSSARNQSCSRRHSAAGLYSLDRTATASPSGPADLPPAGRGGPSHDHDPAARAHRIAATRWRRRGPVRPCPIHDRRHDQRRGERLAVPDKDHGVTRGLRSRTG
jgi:hypothetical protein